MDSVMTPGFCVHCRQFKNLCNSHAVPDAMFKRLFKTPGGAMRVVGDGTTPNDYSTDSWKWPMLCEDCEAEFETRFDGYGVSVLLSKRGNFTLVDGGVRVTGVDQARLAEFFVSVAWRASVSGHQEYSRLKSLSDAHRKTLHDGLTGHGQLPHVALKRFVDAEGVVPREHMREALISPTAQEGDGQVAIFFLFSGFLITVFVTRPTIAMRRRWPFLKPSAKDSPFFVPNYSIEEFKPLLDTMRMARHKELIGLSRLKSTPR